MADFATPNDFPRPRPLGALPGIQDKYLAVEFDGHYYQPGCTPPELYERWCYCISLVEQFVPACTATKAGKRKDMSEADILAQYLVRLVDTKWVSDDEARWVIRTTAKQLGWPAPEDAHGD